jgi:hypothetical protein
MGIGIGIFLGLSLCGLIYLYTQTKNEWNWRRIWKRIGIGIALLILIPIVVMALYEGYESIQRSNDLKPKKITALNGINLGDSLSDVKFRVQLIPNKELSKRWEQETYSVLTEKIDQNYTFNSDGKLDGIVQWCLNWKNGNNATVESINGISCWQKSEDILEKYGKKSIRISCSKDSSDTQRAYDAVDYGVRYVLTSNTVFGIWLIDPKELKDISKSKNWIPCDQVKNKEVSPEK